MEAAPQAICDKVNTRGQIPLAKFGHCCCMIAKDRLIVFGGASGNVGNFAITNDTFCLEMSQDYNASMSRSMSGKLTNN